MNAYDQQAGFNVMLTRRCGRWLSWSLSQKELTVATQGGTRRTNRFLNTATQRDDQPLCILFCGSDDFSISSLRALNDYRLSKTSNIKSIDVATRTDKRTGRGLKVITPPPIKAIAQELGLQLHQFDTFKGWAPPNYGIEATGAINLIVTVSFGLLVPPRILNGCAFGGLNVHPSLLPDLKGAAPIEHAIINGYKYTGVTIQTMHPSKFDEGAILEQSPPPGIPIPEPSTITTYELKKILAPIGAEMLVKAIQKRRYLPNATPLPVMHKLPYRTATKIRPEIKEVNFAGSAADQILRLNRAVPKLWSNVLLADGSLMRILYGKEIRMASEAEMGDNRDAILAQVAVGQPFAAINQGKDIKVSMQPIFIKAADGQILAIPTLTIPGLTERPASAAAAKANLFEDHVMVGQLCIYRFRASP